MQDLPVILKRDNLQSLDKVFDFFIALKFCNSDYYFLNRLKKCEVATYNIVSVYTKSPYSSGSESPWRMRDISPIWNLDVKS